MSVLAGRGFRGTASPPVRISSNWDPVLSGTSSATFTNWRGVVACLPPGGRRERRGGTGVHAARPQRRAGRPAAAQAAALDLEEGLVHVVGAVLELNGGALLESTPKTRAGRRVVAIPKELLPELRAHLEKFAEPDADGRVFVGPRSGPLRRSGFRRIWNKARAEAGLPDLHFHDLRHVGNTLAATTGASLKELMSRMGHASTRAALIYQHATAERDKVIAEGLGDALKAARKGKVKGTKKGSGTQRARKGKKKR